MRRGFRNVFLWLCVALICFSGRHAVAEFSPRLQSMADQAGVTLKLSAQFDTLTPLSQASLAVINDWLSHLQTTLTIRENAGQSLHQIEVTMEGQTLLAVSVDRQAARTLTAFSPSGGAYITGPGEADAWTLLTDGTGGLPDFRALPKEYSLLAEELYPLLAQFSPPKTIRETTSIKNAAASASYENYVLQQEAMNEAWLEILPLLLPGLKTILSNQETWYKQAAESLKELRFSGECRVKRFLDKAGQDMGLQFTGRAVLGDEERKVTLFGGFTPERGGYFSLSLPAVKGKNQMKVTLGGKLTQKDGLNTLTLEGTCQRTREGETQSVSLEASLKNIIKNGGEEWSGKVTVNQARGKEKYTWTLTPKFTLNGEGLTGTLTVQKKKGSAIHIKGTLDAVLSPAGGEEAIQTAEPMDLRGMDSEKARAAVMRELNVLSRVFFRLMADLPQEERVLLTHDLRTDAWMTAPNVPVLEEKDMKTDENTWIVEEEIP